MAAIANFLKTMWNKEPVLTVSVGLGIAAVFLPLVSPYTKLTTMMNQSMPYVYPVPVRDDGNMPDTPAHPCDPQGQKFDWHKKL
ncbi:NADH dehydrogenase [ubiquinone] 1 alpha subcomplex subunit 3 [Brachyhypopomus gauderio]|uniref:NADH dehydrogenase [ubiquinone] 1 alpha subcomplex subunit 3 n=1 Tax=Brachyhypopomus gauderio TaxID=698409 RepID=UPI00404149F7